MSAQLQFNLVAGGTIRPNRFVKLSTSAGSTGLEADANEYAVGVSDSTTIDYTSDNHAESGDPITLQTGLIVTVAAGASITAGDRIKSTADGEADAAATSGTTLQEVLGVAEHDAADGELLRMKWAPETYRPAIA